MNNSDSEFSFNLTAGVVIAGKYEVIAPIGTGWEGEVYKIRELRTGIEYAAKMFFPHRDPKDRSVIAYAKKMHKLRRCSMSIRYHTEEFIQVRGQRVTSLIAELVEGVMLENFIRQCPGKRLPPYMGLHFLHALASGLNEIHSLGEYHGDLHSENIIIVKHGIDFELKLLDMYYWGRPQPANMRYDTVEMIRVFYEALGGRRYYSKHPKTIKKICCGMKPTLIEKKFRNAGELKRYIENTQWEF